MRTRQFCSIASFLFAVGTSGVGTASVFLPAGAGPVVLPGATSAAEADLAGTVISDKMIPFSINNAMGAVLFSGQLQNRVVRSSRNGFLHFYYSIRNTRPGLNGVIRSVFTRTFAATPNVFVDWRPDGLGQINPVTATRTSGVGDLIRFNFVPSGSALISGRESKFFFIKTKVANFVAAGQTRIQLTSGEAVVLNTMSPVN